VARGRGREGRADEEACFGVSSVGPDDAGTDEHAVFAEVGAAHPVSIGLEVPQGFWRVAGGVVGQLRQDKS